MDPSNSGRTSCPNLSVDAVLVVDGGGVGLETSSSGDPADMTLSFRKSDLLLPVRDTLRTNDNPCTADGKAAVTDDCVGCCSEFDENDRMDSESNAERIRQHVYLPLGRNACVDESFLRIPVLMDTRNELLSKSPKIFNNTSTERIVYVSEREIGTVDTSSHCDVLVSDRATTCHILALRSTSCSRNEALCTVAHIVDCSYDTCIRNTFHRHRRYHQDNWNEPSSKNVEMDIHIVGGFAGENSSRRISNWLLHLIADLAYEMKSNVTMTLRTVAITSMNTATVNDGQKNSLNSPIGRGLALNCKTGEVFLAKCTRDVMGPAIQLRHVRLWSSDSDTKSSFNEICNETCRGDRIIISPFWFEPCSYLERLVTLSDDLMLQSCSTSPHCEEDDFCASLREAVQWMSNVSCYKVFGGSTKSLGRILQNQWQPHELVFERCHTPINSWKLVDS